LIGRLFPWFLYCLVLVSLFAVPEPICWLAVAAVLAGSSFPCAGFLFAFIVVAGWAALELSPCLLALLLGFP